MQDKSAENGNKRLALVAVGALLGIVILGGHAKHVVTLNAHAVQYALTSPRGFGVMFVCLLRLAHAGILSHDKARGSTLHANRLPCIVPVSK